ncbi:hypothetical protein GCM10009735_69120 [Actinomadura chokoriensis]
MERYDAEHVPGLLQTAEYARCVFEAFPIDDETEIEKRVALRMARSEYLTSEGGPKFWAVLNEAVIHRQVGGARTMQDQLHHLGEMAKLPNVTLQVLPFDAGAHPAMSGSFTLLGFRNHPTRRWCSWRLKRGPLLGEGARDHPIYAGI